MASDTGVPQLWRQPPESVEEQRSLTRFVAVLRLEVEALDEDSLLRAGYAELLEQIERAHRLEGDGS